MSEDRFTKRRALLLGSTAAALTGAILSMSHAAQAQQEDSDEIEQIVVTGSRITRGNLTAPSPVTVIGADEVDARGTVRVEDLINTLPQAFAAQGANIGNGASGTATVNLRGLGASRTLVLVDGKRMPYGSPTLIPSDLNQIPTQLIERVEVLTGGASAVYGADAVAGVVNFIMQRDFEGVQLDVQGSAFQSGNNRGSIESVLNDFNIEAPGSTLDGRAVDLNLIIGANTADDRGNVTAYFNWKNQNEIIQKDRVSSACAFGTRNAGTEFSCSGSSTTAPARFTDFGIADSSFNFTLDKTTGEVKPFSASTDTFNFAPLNHFVRPAERFSAGAFARYELTEQVELYADIAFHDDRTTAQIAPGGDFFVTESINCDNPFLTPEMVQTICIDNGVDPNAANLEDRNALLFIGRRNVEGGGRTSDIRHTSYRINGGVRGTIADNWDYDVFGQYSTVIFQNLAGNDFNVPRLVQSLEVRLDPNTNQPVCQSVLDGSNPNCVPWNPFALNGVTPEALAFLQTPAIQTGDVTQKVFGATLAGDLGTYGVTSPFAETGVQILVGVEYREDHLSLRNDVIFQNGDLAGQGGPTPDVAGDVNVYEFFGEVQVPLVQDKPFVKELTLNGAYRYSDFWLTTGTQSTYAVGASYAPVDDVRVRGQFQRATRSPNPIELFSPSSIGLFDLTAGPNGLFDPCSGPTPARTAEECARTGVTAAQFGNVADNPAGQFNALFGGNPDLDVEKADTITVGAVITPTMVPGLSVSVDYFDIKVKGFVGTVPPELALNNCLDTGDEFFCSLINRGPGGQLWVNNQSFITATNVNTGSLATKGIDLNVSYDFDIGELGSMRIDYVATYLDSLVTVPLPGEPGFDCAGFYSSDCGTPNPEYRHRMPVAWNTPWGGLNAQVTWRYFGSVKQFGASPAPINAKLGSQNYFDLSLSMQVHEQIRLRGGVNNLFDNDPPVSSVVGAGFGNGNTFPQVYDAVGRFIFLGATFEF